MDNPNLGPASHGAVPATAALSGRSRRVAATVAASAALAPHGTTWTWDLTASTTIRAAGKDIARAKLTTGDRVFAGGPVVGGARDARLSRIGAPG
jgi:hypothetical protein